MRRWIAALLTIFMAVNLMTPALFAQETLSDAAWRADVEQLKAGILRLHPDPFRHVSEDVFHASIDSLLDDIPDLSDDENMVRIMQIAASLRDGHSALWPTAQGNYSIHFYPVLFHSFEDGVYVVDAAPQYEDTIGARLVSVGGVDADAAFDMLRASASGDNSHTLTVAIQMNVVEVLRGAGIINDEPNYVLELLDGQQMTINPAPIEREAYLKMRGAWYYVLDQTQDIPFLENKGENFWFDVMEDERTFYFVYNGVQRSSASGLTINDVVDELEALLESDALDRVIIDLRNNPGGDEGTSRPLSGLLAENDFFDEDGRLIVLIGPRTFSAAVVFSLRLEAETAAVFIGEPTGGRPLMFENNRPVNLSNSGLTVLVSTRARRDAPPEDTRLTIEPHLHIPFLGADYFAGDDPVLDAAIKFNYGDNPS